MPVAPNTILFVANESDFDANINIINTGKTFNNIPDNNETATIFLNQLQKRLEQMMRQDFKGYKKIKSEIIKFSGGVAIEHICCILRGSVLLKQKQLFIISNKKVFTITCTAKEKLFDEYNSSGFEPILKSIKIQ